jgi:hypothetical protein
MAIMGRNEQNTVGKFLISNTAKPIKEYYRTNSCNIIFVHFLLSTPLMFFGHILKTYIVVGCLHRPDSGNHNPLYGLLSIKSKCIDQFGFT